MQLKLLNINGISKLPIEWKLGKLYQYSRLTNGSTPSRKVDIYWEDGTIPWMTSGEVNKKIVKDIDTKITQIGFDNTSLEILPIGTVMLGLNGQGKTKGTTAILEVETTCNQSLCGIIPNTKLYSKFLYYFLESQYKNLRGLVGEGKREGISVSFLSLYPVVIPPIQEQKKISQYLDKKISQIDSLIEKIKKKVELLNEQKTALINQYVTKGLDPNVEIKDSGDEWIGHIPKHWEISKLKFVSKIFGRIGYRGYTVEDIVEEGKGCITLGPGNILNNSLNLDSKTFLSWEKYHESPEIKIFNGDIIFVKTGSTIGKSCFVKNIKYQMTINPQIVVLKNLKINPEYLFYLSICPFFQSFFKTESAGSSTPTISQEKIKDFKIIIPPREEQLKLIEEINKYIEKILFLETKFREKIKMLQEYRQSLISSVVTGKIRITEDMI